MSLHFLNVFKEYRNLKDWLSQGSLFCHFAGDSASGFMEVKNELIGCMKVKNGLIGRIFTINSMVLSIVEWSRQRKNIGQT